MGRSTGTVARGLPVASLSSWPERRLRDQETARYCALASFLSAGRRIGIRSQRTERTALITKSRRDMQSSFVPSIQLLHKADYDLGFL